MDTIVTPVTVITLDSTRIVHSIKADLVSRYFPPVVRLVQYDQSLPVIAVSLMQNGQAYTLPSGAAANIRVHKPDSTYVYNPALGCDSTRKIVYFEVTQAMAAASGDGLAIIEIVVDGDIAGTSLITLHFEENPVPEDAIESSDEWETIYELGERIIASTVTPVSTAAGMTDHNVVYLYTGTESGWNQGHMYYYNGTTWVDAGIAVTDTTLSVAGLAADAKKTGDEIADLKDGLTALGVCDIGTSADLSFYDNVNRLNVSIDGDTITTDGMTSASSYAVLDGTPSKISNKANAPKNFSLLKGHYYTFEVTKISGSYGDHEDYVMFYVTDGTNWLARIKAIGGSITFSPKSNMNVSVLFYVRYGTTVSNLKNRLIITESVRYATYEELTKADVYSESIVDGSLISGLYADNTGAYNNDRLDYVCTQGATAITPGSILKIKISSALALSTHVVFYDSNNSRVSNTNVTIVANGEAIVNVPSTAYYFTISLSHSYGYTLNPDDYSIIVTASDKYSIKEKISVYENNYDFNVIGPWSNNIYTFGTAVWYTATNRIGLKTIITPNTDIVVTADSGYSFSAGEFISTVPAVANEICYTGWISSYLLQAGKHYLINMRKNDNSDISPDNVIYNNHLHFMTADFTMAQNYMILGLKRFPVYLERIGVLPDGLQAFCKYDGKYYSTDGEHIFVISDEFALDDTVDIDVGHGNSFQLGSSNLAYISGWNDNKVYCVDMDTLTLDSTITLPTTGYTTVAIDDINKLAYIFQRDTSPTTETIYNFIVYDYDNLQTISTKKITKAFGGMQACDFVDGQIFVVNGLYNTDAPNGYRVYNTNGDIIAEYVFNSITTEPEGVFFDRTTRELLVSDSVKNVYLVH